MNNYTELRLNLKNNKHTKIILLLSIENELVCFPNENLILAKNEGTDLTLKILKELKL